MAKSVMWKELTAADLREKAKADAVVLFPVASMEQHGPHLPVGVDTYLSEGICKATAEAIIGEMPIVVAPTLWCGMAEHHMTFGGTFTFDIPTYRAVLLCFLNSLARHGFRRVLIVNGHGGNIHALAAFIPDLARETGLALRVTTPYDPARAALVKILEDQDDGVHHACEAETSMIMALVPDLVRRDKLSEAHGPKHWTLEPAGAARFRSFRDATPSGVVGDARRASAEKGEKLIAACRDCLVAMLRHPQMWEPPPPSRRE
jgi:creatinine amidohydrolase